MKVILPLAVVIAVLLFFGVGGVNSLVRQDEDVNAAWAQVQNQYQRRMDLIPNLVSTVKGYASHEKETLQAVIQARANATKMTVNLDDAKQVQEYMNAQQGLSSALSRLLAVSENYPDLKANQNFLSLQDQLEGTCLTLLPRHKARRLSLFNRGINEKVSLCPVFIISGCRACFFGRRGLSGFKWAGCR